jgi:hypothetical protein
MVIVFAVIFTSVGGAQERQASLRANAVAMQHVVEPRIVGGQLRSVSLTVPQVNDAGGKAPILAA